MLNEASPWLQVDHDHVQELNLHDSISRYCASSFRELSSFHAFQLEVESNPVNVKDQFSSEEECYDELWLFEKESWISICMCLFSLKFGVERVIIKQWYGATPLRYDLLMQKGSYFS